MRITEDAAPSICAEARRYTDREHGGRQGPDAGDQEADQGRQARPGNRSASTMNTRYALLIDERVAHAHRRTRYRVTSVIAYRIERHSAGSSRKPHLAAGRFGRYGGGRTAQGMERRPIADRAKLEVETSNTGATHGPHRFLR